MQRRVLHPVPCVGVRLRDLEQPLHASGLSRAGRQVERGVARSVGGVDGSAVQEALVKGGEVATTMEQISSYDI